VVHWVVMILHCIHTLHIHHMDILLPRRWFVGWSCSLTIFIPSTSGISIPYPSTCSL
jgi:hypothetical protein